MAVQFDSERLSSSDADYLRLGLARCGVNTVRMGHHVRGMRVQKSPRELAHMRRAGEICAASMAAALRAMEVPLATEDSVAAAAEHAARVTGGDYKAYPTFVAVGSNGDRGHYAGNDSHAPLREGQSVFVELAGCMGRYHVAMMRTAFVGRVVPTEMRRAETHVVRALQRMRECLVPGVMPSAVRRVVESALEPLLPHGWVGDQPTQWLQHWDWFPDGLGRVRRDLHTLPHKRYGATDSGERDPAHPALGETSRARRRRHIRHGHGACARFKRGRAATRAVAAAQRRTHATREYVSCASNPRDHIATTPPAFGSSSARWSSVQRPCGTHVQAHAVPGIPCDVYIKDESARMGQKSFKALGVGYAVCAEIRRARTEFPLSTRWSVVVCRFLISGAAPRRIGRRGTRSARRATAATVLGWRGRPTCLGIAAKCGSPKECLTIGCRRLARWARKHTSPACRTTTL